MSIADRARSGELSATQVWLTFLLIPIAIFYRPFVFAFGWAKFVAPLGVQVLSYWHAFGLSTILAITACLFVHWILWILPNP